MPVRPAASLAKTTRERPLLLTNLTNLVFLPSQSGEDNIAPWM